MAKHPLRRRGEKGGSNCLVRRSLSVEEVEVRWRWRGGAAVDEAGLSLLAGEDPWGLLLGLPTPSPPLETRPFRVDGRRKELQSPEAERSRRSETTHAALRCGSRRRLPPRSLLRSSGRWVGSSVV
ncbi:hypothetical protein TIFTF001_018120 [Ficus carica]|uniref:Uncharacterized protein n=1 Tax=Ficus carica TaxID=3494 RepID=A0AA88A3M7_FICCA|nr:hypothetical protein TIFTF001_018120 [Ficus carica]